jgi:hypothetical protein
MYQQGIVDPAHGQTESEIGAYLERCIEGSPIAIHETHSGILTFTLTVVVEINRRTKGRLTTKAMGYGGDRWYVKHGRSCRFPTGQSHLVVPTPEIEAYVAQHGSLGLWTYRTARFRET